MHRNRHDTWKRFCEEHADLLVQTGLPVTVTRSEHRFRDLLRSGYIYFRDAHVALEELSTKRWAALYRFAGIFFLEFESYAPEGLFPGFRAEVTRRGEVFPRNVPVQRYDAT